MTTVNANRIPKGWLIGAVALCLGFVLGGFVCRGVAPESGDVPHVEAHAEIWTCSMHPQIRKDAPGKCPICGMDLIPVQSGDNEANLSPNQIAVSERARVLGRIQTTEVARRDNAHNELRMLGKLQPNESTLKTVTAWTGGRIDRLFVSTTGERVRAGQTLATIYSPEVYSAHQDLLIAARQVSQGASLLPQAGSAAKATLRTAKERLRLLGVPNATISELVKADSPTTSLRVRTPFSGTVIERIASEGAYIDTGTPLYRIANLGSLWVQLEAYESDLPHLSLGQSAHITLEALPGQEFNGRVAFIEPTIDPKRRVAQIRVEVKNASGQLRPGMFAIATIQVDTDSSAGGPVVVPRSAALFTGKRSLVYVELEQDGRYVYEARRVALGPRLADSYVVLAGVVPGERVVTRGAFAIDADLQIRGGQSMMNQFDDAELADDIIVPSTGGARKRLAPIVVAYLKLQRGLAADDWPATKGAAELFEKTLQADWQAGGDSWRALRASLKTQAQGVAGSESLASARASFKALSISVAKLLRTFGNPLKTTLRVAHCPMADDNAGAIWVQDEDDIQNPYFGVSMLECGSIEEQVPPGQHAAPRVETKPAKANPAPGHQH